MTLPRKKSRTITVDGVRYRWLVTPVNEHHELQVFVEHADGQGQCLRHVRSQIYSTAGIPSMTPRYIAALVRQALASGWRPSVPGHDFTLLPRYEDHRRRHHPTVDELAMCCVVDLDALRCNFPWRHHDPRLSAQFRLHAAISDKALGTLFGHLARYNRIGARKRGHAILEELASETHLVVDEDAPEVAPEEVELRFYIPGGIDIVAAGRWILGHGCCVSVDEWRQWPALLETGQQPWNGHDPFSTAIVEGEDGVRLVDPGFSGTQPGELLSRATYKNLLQRLELDLRGFLEHAYGWVAERAPRGCADRLIARLAASIHIEPN